MDVISLFHFQLEPINLHDTQHACAYLELLHDNEINSKMFRVEDFIGDFDFVLENNFNMDDYFIRMDGQLIGYIKITFGSFHVDLSYALFEHYRGNKIMSQVLAELLLYIQARYSRCFVKALVNPENIGSQKTLEKAGFILEESSNSSYLHYIRKLDSRT